MSKTRVIALPVLCLVMLACAQTFLDDSRMEAYGQQGQATSAAADAQRGIELYQQGDDKGAIELLRRALKQREDLVAAWHYLGMAHERQGQPKDARKAHEKSAILGEMMVEWVFSAESFGKPTDANRQLRAILLLAAESADKYLKLSSKPSSSKVSEWRSRSEVLREYAQMSGDDIRNSVLGKIYSPKEVTTKARVLTRPEPQYTAEARSNNVEGTVVLRGVVAFDGKLRGIRVMSGLPHGLTQTAIEAARGIKFIPATINGEPVSQFIQIEYNFNRY